MVVLGSTITVRCLADNEVSGGRDIYFDVLNADGEPAVAGGYIRAAV